MSGLLNKSYKELEKLISLIYNKDNVGGRWEKEQESERRKAKAEKKYFNMQEHLPSCAI